jgi:hypothetical protein
MKAVICPVCGSVGKTKEQVCHGCYGRGWVTVPEDTMSDTGAPPDLWYSTRTVEPLTFSSSTTRAAREIFVDPETVHLK